MAPVWKCDRLLNVEPRSTMLIPYVLTRDVASVYLPMLLNERFGPPTCNST